MKVISEEVTVVTSPFNEKLFIAGLQAKLSSTVFKELINGEKAGIKITVKMEVPEDTEEVIAPL